MKHNAHTLTHIPFGLDERLSSHRCAELSTLPPEYFLIIVHINRNSFTVSAKKNERTREFARVKIKTERKNREKTTHTCNSGQSGFWLLDKKT